jgi:hypothetical protein
MAQVVLPGVTGWWTQENDDVDRVSPGYDGQWWQRTGSPLVLPTLSNSRAKSGTITPFGWIPQWTASEP